MEDISQPGAPIATPHGPARAHAQQSSIIMGAISGTTIGVVFGGLWALASGQHRWQKTLGTALVATLAGGGISASTWREKPSATSTPLPALPALEFARQEYTARIDAQRQEPTPVTRQSSGL